jgi:hypothetical protein
MANTMVGLHSNWFSIESAKIKKHFPKTYFEGFSNYICKYIIN